MSDPIHHDLFSDSTARRLRRERNWFALGAVATIAVAMGVSVPRRVARERVHRTLNAELLYLEDQVKIYQGIISRLEKQITDEQLEIRKLQTSSF